MIATLIQEVDPERLARVCGDDPTFTCRQALDWGWSDRSAELADIVFAKPLTILLILVVAWIANQVVHAAIGRFAATLAGDQATRRKIKRRLRRTALSKRLPASVLATGALDLRAEARAETLGYVLRSVATFVIWSIAMITILGELGINLGPLIAGAGIAGIALGFGAQSLVKDFLAGIFILVEDQYGVGDHVDVGEASGAVEAVSLRTTRLRDVSGTVWHVPNGQIMRVGNMSQQWARALLDIDVAHGTDLDEAQRIIKDVADGLWRDTEWTTRVIEEPEVWGVEALTPNAVTLRLVVKTLPAAQWAVMRELRIRIKAALDAGGIEIPTPQRTVWVRREPGSSTASGSGDELTDEAAEDAAGGA